MKKRYVVIILAVAVAGAGLWWRGDKDADADLRTITLERQEVVQEVAFTGRLTAAEKVELAFELGGAVTEVRVHEGERVEAGQILARIDTSAAQLEVAKAAADKHTGQEKTYLAWQQAEEAAEKTAAENARLLERRRQAVRDAKSELDQRRTVRQQTVQESGSESAAAETAYATVLVAETAYHTAQQALEEALKTVNKSNAAATDAAQTAKLAYEATEQTSGAVAGLSSLEALEQLASVPLEKSVLTAPLTGVVTKREVEVGEVAQVGKTVLEIQTPEALEVVAEVAETDAAKLNVGMETEMTFDALPGIEGDILGKVSYIAPAAEIIEGVPTYTVKIAVESAIDGLKPGLTTNVTVHARQVDNVLAVPRRAIIERDGQALVRIKENEDIREVPVRIGLIGSDGLAEIMGPLTEGMIVVISSPDETN